MEYEHLIGLLKAEVESTFGHGMETSNDFGRLSDKIRETTGQNLSDSTLKRIWGYVTYQPTPHRSTLDVLAQYVGFKSFGDFQKQQNNSGFFNQNTISSKDLKVGEIIIVSWLPDRTVRMKYLGDNSFLIEDSGNSKLRKGDLVEARVFTTGLPLFFDKVVRDGEEMPVYIAGKSTGITEIRQEN